VANSILFSDNDNLARPERFELPTAWFVVISKNLSYYLIYLRNKELFCPITFAYIAFNALICGCLDPFIGQQTFPKDSLIRFRHVQIDRPKHLSHDLTGKIMRQVIHYARTKGQVVIPEDIRKRLGLEAGSQFVVVAGKDAIILKTISPPSMDEFDELIKTARRQARKAGIKRSNIKDAVTEVRSRR
jgi:AbrB family looped-hinge helix DNA binding protein